MKQRILLPFMVIYIGFISNINGQSTRYVPSQYSTITDAISAASNGDTIDITGYISTPSINLWKSLTFRGHGTDSTIISCSRLGVTG